MTPFDCPKCGYRNYITREDLDREHIEAVRIARGWRRRARRSAFWRGFLEGLAMPITGIIAIVQSLRGKREEREDESKRSW